MNVVMYWKGMRTTIRSITRSCRTCQINKRWTLNYGHLPPKTVISNPWECLCVNLIGPYTLKGKDNLQIDFMALTMINPTSSWFEITELPVITQLHRQIVNSKELLAAVSQLYCTVQTILLVITRTVQGYFWHASLRPDTRCVMGPDH
jgi:hypothetical protein